MGISEIAERYHDRGWVVLAEGIDQQTLAELRDSVTRISALEREEVVHETGGEVVRALHGCHRFDDVCARLVRHPRLVDLAEALIGDQVYVYQFKVNLKNPRVGQQWPWHQDFAFWSIEDGMPAPDAVNIAINLDEVHEGNGPLTVLTGSHALGVVGQSGSAASGDWRQHVSADLAHSVPADLAAELATKHQPEQLVGPAGAVAAFHPNIVHSSSDNLSADRRTVLFITYNSIKNVPSRVSRPEFLVDRDTTPVTKLAQ
ncbi:phytanoyl-CoA dioxygenase [Kribbella antibiotica]|uniref:Phytanoyl-CoA dioxygenase n=1 Tax=Kribbella antibiotica TaxID=190195 RepID=A0A4R4ZT36_9ACTN|nr:phytanoyl-CoA dioxygenase family protein [Kribbella antibiotica]TDD61274.1 phytanoyl-CoA dioxygenase [Kribbella antibiotica]